MFRLPPPPSNNNYKRHYCADGQEKGEVHTIRAYRTKRADRFKYDAGWLAKEAGIRMHYGPVEVHIIAYQKPDSKNATDLDNLPKVLFDALEGVAWENDRQIAYYTVRRRELARGKPYIEVEILPLAIILGGTNEETTHAPRAGSRRNSGSPAGTGTKPRSRSKPR
jgi:Holliday junction resolvase RusA-like endonuclease